MVTATTLTVPSASPDTVTSVRSLFTLTWFILTLGVPPTSGIGGAGPGATVCGNGVMRGCGRSMTKATTETMTVATMAATINVRLVSFAFRMSSLCVACQGDGTT